MTSSTTYSGVWWVPDGSRRFSGEKHSGTLLYNGTERITLDIIHNPTQGTIFRAYETYNTIWGEDAGGNIYTLFGATLTRHLGDFSKATFTIRFVLVGMHVRSLDEIAFDSCRVYYPFLNRWMMESHIEEKRAGSVSTVALDFGVCPPFLSLELEEGIILSVWTRLSKQVTRYSMMVTQDTVLDIYAPKKTSLSTFLKTISEFTYLQSFALFTEQNSDEVYFWNKGDATKCQLLFKKNPSVEPKLLPFIKYDKLMDKMPDIIAIWHSDYDRIYPIVRYLIRSFNDSQTFDVPDFLTIAHALDGFFKRFVNFLDGKNTKQFEHEINKLIKRIDGVEAIEKCKIDSLVLRKTRDKYTHLIPDEDEDIAGAIDDMDEMYWLTQKCKILLACSILKHLGLEIEDINVCCASSPVSNIIDNFPIWLDDAD